MNEIWNDINGYEGYFQVSNLGNFRSLDRYVHHYRGGERLYHGKPLLTESIAEGYLRIVLMKEHIRKRYMCHRLVAETFIPNPNNKPFVNHINGIKNDNRVENLEWCTQSENELHSYNVLNNTMKGKTYPRKVLCVDENITFPSLLNTVQWIGGTSCIEGLKKSIKANRLYHNHKFQFI